MKKLFYSLITLLLVIGTTIAVSYAWFMNQEFKDPKVSGYSTAAYFASGDGSKENPYIITNRRHLYNLAWLQYLGNFNNTEIVDGKTNLKQQFHFKVTAINNEINMEGYSLPPIGTEEYPFVGTFDGGGCVIKNLTTSNNIGEVQNHPQTVNEINNASIIGMFGVVGNYNDMYANIETSTSTEAPTTNSIVPDISNFYLDNIMISTTTNTSLVGLLAGYVSKSGKISNVGIHYSMFKLATGVKMIDSFKAISNYALIGDYDAESVNWEDKPASGGPGYGASTDLGYLESVYGSTGIEKGMAYPFQAEKTDIINPSVTTKSMKLSSGDKNVTVATTQAATSSNIGYYVGSDIKFYNKPVTYKDFYYPNHSSESYLLPYTSGSTTYKAPSQDIIDYLNSTKGQYQMRITGSEIDIHNEGGLVVVENGKVGDYTGDVLLPQRCIWVAPRQAGTLKFVLPNVESKTMGLRINKLTRSKPKDYSSYISNSTQILEFNAVLLGKHVYYFEIEVTQEDVDAGYEYAITGGNGYKTYASYVDIGAAGGGSTPTYTGTINGVDFVYESGGNLADITAADYKKSDVAFEVTGTAGADGVYIYFKRKETLGVLYFVSGSGVTVTPGGTGNKSLAKDKNCDDKTS